ncbi:FAD-dependent monooxygenase [Mycobacterium sp. CVI_P3]|uniref:FAD-dependent monooxygenase n=1 Tax=Mycobacterium pinniadriaticum TaxID=2994102 RepID=A0ABT3S8H7_9MYCO|nr:FAD-dependent monooxygenase [Mycobacterium pinniadriaticum]MCX2929385.1 FAD-dependent monooxygenase [Mycobacterium pinniadriaticum]MCX2935809.1 FAD-dependent monooxygenase [Mycobacterium pinniadriaticum]
MRVRQCGHDHAVVIAGGGPSGLMLAGELALAGVDVAIVERRTSQQVIGQRAGGLHCRTLEVLDQRGIAERFLAAGQAVQVAGFAQIRLDISDFPTPHPYGLALWQSDIERLLAEWVGELGVPIRRGSEVTRFTQDERGVVVEVSDGRMLRARYLVGCDGGRSRVRKAAGIDFTGWDPTTSYLIAAVEVRDEPKWGIHRDAIGIHGLDRQKDGEPVRVMVTERQLGPSTQPTLEDLSAALTAVYGTDFGIHSPTSIARFTDATRQAAAYRDRRVLLAGDAAHIHHPVGGQGLNTGVQDAVNLGWKLAQVINGWAPDTVLDTYHAERHPVAARVLRTTMAQIALLRTDERTKALHDNVSELLSMAEPRKRYAARMSGLDIRYELGDGHPLLGRRMPDLELRTATGSVRIFELLHDARPVLLDLTAPSEIDIHGWADRIKLVSGRYGGRWELPVLGTVSAPGAVLIRPDGHVAWVGQRSPAGLIDALTRWFGPPVVAA